MKLVIAEIPNVARSIAEVLGAAVKEDGCLSSTEYIVSWCVRHLLEPAPADATTCAIPNGRGRVTKHDFWR